jgi:hypothetical protein
MAQNTRKHVFISHHHADDEHVTNLTNLLARSGHDVRNSSIRAKPENQRRLDEGRVSEAVLRRLLRIKIAWAGTVVVLIGKETHERPWVNWEIEQAQEKGKRIVGVYIRGGREADIPPALEKYASSIVGWNSQCILEAIDGKRPQFQNPDCTVRTPVHVGSNSKC